MLRNQNKLFTEMSTVYEEQGSELEYNIIISLLPTMVGKYANGYNDRRCENQCD